MTNNRHTDTLACPTAQHSLALMVAEERGVSKLSDYIVGPASFSVFSHTGRTSFSFGDWVN